MALPENISLNNNMQGLFTLNLEAGITYDFDFTGCSYFIQNDEDSAGNINIKGNVTLNIKIGGVSTNQTSQFITLAAGLFINPSAVTSLKAKIVMDAGTTGKLIIIT